MTPTTPRRDTTVLTRALGRTPYYVVAGGLAVIFLFPLLWNAWASVSAQPGTAQDAGYGLGNYRTRSTTTPACGGTFSTAPSSRPSPWP